MNFVIPMAGRGQRFVEAGYQLPKPLIQSHGKTLLEWSIDSLPLELCTKLICIVLNEHCINYKLDEFIQSKYGNEHFKLEILILDQVTQGQAQTVALSQSSWNLNQDLIIFNADTAFDSPSLLGYLSNYQFDGILACFNSTENRFSFASVNEAGIVIKTAEKEVISNNALNGLYHFKYPSDFLETYNYHVENQIKVNGEYYVAPMYNYLISKGKQFTIYAVEKNYILGTPQELLCFKPN